MLAFKLFAICSLVLLVLWVVLGKTVRIPAFSFAGKTAKIPAPRYASPARKDVWGLCAIHLVYLTVTVGGCSLLYQLIGLADWMVNLGMSPADIGPFTANMIYITAAIAGILLLLSLFLTVRRSAAWFSVSCHSALMLCVCWLIIDWLASLATPKDMQMILTHCLFAYLGIVAIYAVVFLLYAKMRKKPVLIA